MPIAPIGVPPTGGAPALPRPARAATHRPGTRGYRRANLALFAAGVATFAMLYAPQALLPGMSGDLGLTPGQASLTVSAATIGTALAVLPVSALSERWGRTRVMRASVLAGVLIALVLPLAPDLGTLVALRAVQGVVLAGLPATAMAYLAEEMHPRALTSAMGLYVAGNSVGGMTSRLLPGAVTESLGWRVALGSVGVLALLCAVLFALLLPRAAHARPGTVGVRALLRACAGHLGDPLLLRLYTIGLLMMTVFGAVYTVLGYRLVASPFGLSEGTVGLVFLVYLVGTASSAAAGRLAGRLGRRGALYVGIGTAASGLLLSLSSSLGTVLAGLVLVTAGFFTGHAVASSSVSRAATSGRAQASALYLAAFYLGNSVGGTLGASAYHAAGWAGTVTVGLAALAAAGGITLYATRRAVAARRAAASACRWPGGQATGRAAPPPAAYHDRRGASGTSHWPGPGGRGRIDVGRLPRIPSQTR